MHTKRFEILDLFRFLAILIVMLYHYFTRWSEAENSSNLYPYGEQFNHFHWGRMGVQFFYIISGFVIYMTLERSVSFLDFAKKRMVRLWPSMLLMSSITFLVFIVFDNEQLFPDSHQITNLLYSWSFLGKSMNSSGLSYVDGSYWSLWVEIQFYILSALLFFTFKKINKPSFFPFALLGIALIIAIVKPHLKAISEIFNLFNFFNFFVMGVVFKELFRAHSPWSLKVIKWHFIISLLLVLEWLFFADDGISKALDGIFVLAFYCFIFLSHRQFEPKNPIILSFVFLGEASYISYLLHQNIGVLMINKINYHGTFSFLVPLLVMSLMFSISAFLYTRFEQPIMIFLKKRLFATKSINQH